MKRGTICKLMVCVLAVIVAASFMPQPASAASKKVSSRACDQVVKDGNVAYCAGANEIYQVKLSKSGKVKKVRRIVKGAPVWDSEARMLRHMMKIGKYIYYVDYGASDGSCIELKRVNIKTKKTKSLVFTDEGFYGYAIKGKRLYAKYDRNGKTVRKVMKLNGKSKKKTSKKIVMKKHKTNKNGYTMSYRTKNGYVKAYLKTPKGKYYLGKTKVY